MTDKMKNCLIIILMIVSATVCCHAKPVNRALVIGLGKQEDRNWAKINGDNDVRFVTKMLEGWNYTDISILKNETATKKGIIEALISLTRRCRIGDNVYIHYSGHGQLITDLNGDEATRWNGWHAQWDESIIPYDAYMNYCSKDHGEKHITDDELGSYLAQIRSKIGLKGEMIVVLDACHSGDATQGEQDETVRGVDTKFNIPRTPGTPQEARIPEQWLTISACQPYQLCTEIKAKKMGKLTYAICALGHSLLRLGNKDMEYHLEQFLKRYEGRLPQSPMVTGRKRY